MPRNESPPNRHHYRVWIKWAIESGLLDKVPPVCDAEGCGTLQPTLEYARGLLAELRDPDSSRRPLKQIIADARQFRGWVEARQKHSMKVILTEIESGELGARVVRRRASGTTDTDTRPRSPSPRQLNPRQNPMWDDWLDS
jgi:hypothetical protein